MSSSQNPNRSSFLRRLASKVMPPSPGAASTTSSSSSSSDSNAENAAAGAAAASSRLPGGSHTYNVQHPAIGPIIGTSHPTEVRIFLAAPQSPARRAISVGSTVTAAAKLSTISTDTSAATQNDTSSCTSRKETITPITTLMRPEFDHTAVIAFHDLRPNTEYELKCGWYIVDQKHRDKSGTGGKGKMKGTLNFRNAIVTKFKTASVNKTEERDFVFGSCRYLLKFHGRKDISFFDRRGDKTFRSILKQMEDGKKVDVFLMLGDQIYADDLNVLKEDDEVGEFYKRYRDCFGQTYLRELMTKVPTSMTLDDHEIKNDFPKGMSGIDMRTRYINAMHAYQIYQASHSTVFDVEKRHGSIRGMPNKYWYTFENGCCAWFVMDVRTERVLPEFKKGDPKMISNEQMEAVKEWLTGDKTKDRIKFVATSVPLYPVVRNSKDKWSGFPRQKAELLEHIFSNRIEKVVFLSGDLHNTMSMELQSDGHKIWSIVSSPFFWPIPTHLPSEFIKDGDFKLINGRVLSTEYSSKIICESNFTRVHARPEGLSVKVYSRKGDLMDESEFSFGSAKMNGAPRTSSDR